MAVSLRELWCTRAPYPDLPQGRVARVREEASYNKDAAHGREAEDTELIARIRAGDEAAFDALFLAQFPRLVGFANVLLGSSDAAQDVAAEVFLRIWRRRASWDPRGSVAAYLFTAVRNQAANIRRGQRREAALLVHTDLLPETFSSSASQSVEEIAERDEVLTKLWRTIDELPDQRRAVAYLRWREGLEYTEIAAITGQSVNAVKMQVSRVLATLRRVIPGLLE